MKTRQVRGKTTATANAAKANVESENTPLVTRETIEQPIPLTGEALAILSHAQERASTALRVMEDHQYEVAALFYLLAEHFETHNGESVMGKSEHGMISAGLQNLMRGVEKRLDAALVQLFNARGEMLELERKTLAKMEKGR